MSPSSMVAYISPRSSCRQDISFFDDDGNSAGSLTSFLAEKIALVDANAGPAMQVGWLYATIGRDICNH